MGRFSGVLLQPGLVSELRIPATTRYDRWPVGNTGEDLMDAHAQIAEVAALEVG
jgi:hypothetical protein